MSQKTSPPSSQDSENVLGVVIFIVYILAALLLTSLITYDLVSAYASLSARKAKTESSPDPVAIGLLTTLSTISFSVLSYHMLNVLILSYQTWAYENSLPLPTSIFSVTIDSRPHLWHWAKTSTLFRDFASDITGSAARFWWTQAALSSSMVWSMCMAVRAAESEIPHLYRYWLLMQILPSSFGQILFCLAVSFNQEISRSAEEKVWVTTAWVQAVAVAGYMVAVWNVARNTGGTVDMRMVFLVRALLFLPLVLSKPKRNKGLVWEVHTTMEDAKQTYSAWIWLLLIGAIALQVRQTIEVWTEEKGLKTLFTALDEKPAVSALGYDVVISLGGSIGWFGRAQSNLRKSP